MAESASLGSSESKDKNKDKKDWKLNRDMLKQGLKIDAIAKPVFPEKSMLQCSKWNWEPFDVLRTWRNLCPCGILGG